MGHMYDKYLYGTYMRDMYLTIALHGTPTCIWDMYVTNTYMGRVCGICIWKIHYIGQLKGTCVCEKYLYGTRMLGKYFSNTLYGTPISDGHMCDKYLYGTHMREMYLAITLYRTRI